ncbi:MAG: transcriptional repressor, partial [Vicinamibacteria bacterium]|nr:transcriptional repressor [Vicinamibacteria bacterium]
LAQARVPGIGIATVYRAVRRMLEKGRLVMVRLPGGSVAYESAGRPHHHHFHCHVCGRAWDLPGCPLPGRLCVPPRFRIESHELVIHGRCDDCGAAKLQNKATALVTKRRSTSRSNAPGHDKAPRTR